MFWQGVTRAGEVGILLPAALLAAWLLMRRNGEGRMAGVWLLSLGLAVLITLASKLAFMGWGLGWAALDFSGVSGHALMAAAVYPVLFVVLMPAPSARSLWVAAGAGTTLALLVGVSRIVVGAHSGSEVIAGLVMGGLVSLFVLQSGHALARVAAPQQARGSLARTLAAPLAFAMWLTVMPAFGPHFNSHSIITDWSLRLSGRSAPYTRGDMQRESLQRSQDAVEWGGHCVEGLGACLRWLAV